MVLAHPHLCAGWNLLPSVVSTLLYPERTIHHRGLRLSVLDVLPSEASGEKKLTSYDNS